MRDAGTGRLAMDAGYGFGLGADRGVLTRYAGMAIGETSRRTLHTGARWKHGADIGVRLEASRSESAEREDAEMQVRSAVRF